MVADASIIPFTVDGNTSAATYLIGYTIARKMMMGAKKKQNHRIINHLHEDDGE
ncbi:hypothetical protein [Cohnella sp. REN36]|uniref:hypothetical protein n=1 Tax=Cohnella sp. REN36 TaxID=2887347 RepID=UPI00351D4922